MCFLSSSCCSHGHISVVFFSIISSILGRFSTHARFFFVFLEGPDMVRFSCFFFRHFNSVPIFFSNGWVFILPFFIFFCGFFGLFPLNLAFFLRYAGYSGTEVSCTHSVFLFVSFLRSLVLKVCYLIDLLTVNLALYILFFLLFSCVMGHYVTRTCVLGHCALRARRA